jgi:hypothetical protein
MDIMFSRIFTLLQHEGGLAEGCLSVGLTALRNAKVTDKRKFYSGFFNTTIAFERLMKLIVVIDYMLSNDFKSPTEKQLKAYGHDLVTLYQASVNVANKINIPNIQMPTQGSVEGNILNLLSEFAKSSRYYNLNSLSQHSSINIDPLVKWEEIINSVIEEDVPDRQLKKRLELAKQIYNQIKDITSSIQHGMSGEPLTPLQALSLPERQLFAAPYLMVRVFNILLPLINTVSKLGDVGFYKRASDGTGPHIPLFMETLVY